MPAGPRLRSNQPGFIRVRALSPSREHILWTVAAVLSGLLGPAIILLIGIVSSFFEHRQLPHGVMPLGQWLSVPIPDWLSVLHPVTQLFLLVSLGLVLAFLQSATIWISYRGVLDRAFSVIEKLHFQMLHRMLARASDEGIAAQRWKAQQVIEKSLPQVQSGLIAWWRAMPRSLVLLISSLLLAMLIDPWLTLLAICLGLIMWRGILWLHDEDDDHTSNWEIPDSRNHLLELLQQAPLLSRIQPSQGIDHQYAEQLRTLRSLQHRSAGRWAKTIPVIGLATGAATALLLLVLGGHLLEPGSDLHLASAFMLILCVITAVAASARLLAMWQELGSTSTAADAVFSFLDYQRTQASSLLVGLPRIRQAVTLRDVSMYDGLGQNLLDQLSLELKPGTVTALMGSDRVSVQTLVELLLGCGRPATGRLAFDGLEVGEIHPNSLSKQVIWVAQDGPLWEDTVEQNLRAGSEATLDQIIEVCRSLGIYDAIQQLPEGFQTVISSGESRLTPILHYGIGLARAILKKPSIAVLQEPLRAIGPITANSDDEMIAKAVRILADAGLIVVILPQRIPSLRSADRVVLIHQGKVVVEGSHTHLLENHDLYRHLNYLLFNPYRQTKDAKK